MLRSGRGNEENSFDKMFGLPMGLNILAKMEATIAYAASKIEWSIESWLELPRLKELKVK